MEHHHILMEKSWETNCQEMEHHPSGDDPFLYTWVIAYCQVNLPAVNHLHNQTDGFLLKKQPALATDPEDQQSSTSVLL